MPSLEALAEQAARVVALNNLAIEDWRGLEAALDRDLHIHMSGGLMVAETAEQARLLEAEAARLAAPLDVFAPDTLRHSTRWGSRGYAWGEVFAPEVAIAYTTAEAGDVTFRVTNDKGIEYATWTDEAAPGLNYTTWDYAVARAFGEDHEPGEDDGRIDSGVGGARCGASAQGVGHDARLPLQDPRVLPGEGLAAVVLLNS